MSQESDSVFSDRGRVYQGNRYPDGTIRPPHCTVTVLPEDGRSYQLDIEVSRKFLSLAIIFDWGTFGVALGKSEPVYQRSLYEKKATYFEKVRKRSEAEWKKLEVHQKRCRQLAFAILYDLTGNKKVSEACYEKFSGRIIKKLPEAKWTLTVQQIEDCVGAELVLAALGNIGEKS
jgi:hypothetical protein